MIDSIYANLIECALSVGEMIETRNAKAYRLFAEKVCFTTTPLIVARKTAWKNALREWEWFMSGSSCIRDLHPAVHDWWRPWADVDGNVLYNYSQQFRDSAGTQNRLVDQIAYLIDGIRSHPFSRRNVITTWNTADMTAVDCLITNCHGTAIQCFVDLKDRLHLVTYQRSVDVICGLPHNWIQYWAFLMWLASRGGRAVGSLTWIGGDVHVYEQHVDLAKRVQHLASAVQQTPELIYTPSSDAFKADDFTLSHPYKPLLSERAEMIV